MDLTLDIPEVQLLVHYPNDPGGFFWHHRILLSRIEGSRWLTLTPDHDIQQHDLAQIPHRVLDRRSPFPDDIAADVYAHDPLARGVLNGFKRRAATQAVILGVGALEDSEASQWVVCDSTHPRFGEAIADDLLQNEATGLAFSMKGVVVVDGEELFVERVLSSRFEAWKKERRMHTADIRLLGDHRDSGGKRRLDLSSAVTLMKDHQDNDFPISGSKAAKELHEAVLGGQGN